MRSLLFKNITIPVAFKTIPYSRRAQLWNRQASIVTDLTMLAFRHGWHWVPISVPVLVMPSASFLGVTGMLRLDPQLRCSLPDKQRLHRKAK
jgi:hypothetical protein